MKVTVSKYYSSRAMREALRSHGFALGLLAAATAAIGTPNVHAAKYDDYSVPSSSGAMGPIGGESVRVPGANLSVPNEGYSESVVDGGIDPNRNSLPAAGYSLAGPPAPAQRNSHPGILTALYDNHMSKVAARDAAGLPQRSTKGIVNRLLGPADPRWTAQVDALFLWQEPLEGRVLFNDAAGDPVFNVTDVRSEVGIGPRAALMMNLDCVHAIEANYFNVQNIAGTGALPANADGTTYSMNDLVGYNFSDVGDALVTSTGAIQSFELNWRHWNTGAFTWLVGFRWVEWNENLSIVDSYVPIDPLEPGGTDTFGVLTQNDLYGAQIGGDVLLWNAHSVIRFNAVGKAGVFYNASALQRTSVSSDREPFDPLNVSATGDQTAFFGEVGINGSLKLTEWLSWRAGYNFFWLSGVAVPANQLSLTDPGETPPTTGINTTGSVLLHGVTTGLEARW